MKKRTRQAERGIAVIVTSIMLVILIPVIGLAIDVTLLYVDKARLQGAVDGAALAGAEGLSRGTNDAAQKTAAAQAAAQYVFLNYPTSFFFTNSVTVNQATDITIDETVANQRTVSVTAHANVPTLFMRWLNFTSTNVIASATVTRRDVNVVLVMDRSGSLQASGSCAAVQQAAINFVNKFANGSDNVGLVTFASSTNADFPIANDFQTATVNVPTIINQITCAGSTSSPMALWTAYDQLVGLAEPAALNVILFFTDGTPTGVNVNMPIATSSSCEFPNPATASIPYKYLNGLYNTYTGGDTFFGLLKPTGNGTVPPDDTNTTFTTDGQGGKKCAFLSSETNYSDFIGVPEVDVFGDNLASGYQPTGPYVTCGTQQCLSIGSGSNQNASSMAQNGTDQAAISIRGGATEPASASAYLNNIGKSLSGVIIYSIGLGNATTGTLNQDLLNRVSNTTASGIYNSSEATGAFILAPTSADINAAFATIAAEILRIAK
ncbi:MAG: pilus assembly protein TadG-related protein [Bryobacteraceae bacterium]